MKLSFPDVAIDWVSHTMDFFSCSRQQLSLLEEKKKTTTNQSRPSKTPLLGNQEAVRALMKRCHSLGWHKQAVDNWLPAANENLLMPQPAGFFHFFPSDRRCFIAAVNITRHAEFMLILILIHSSPISKGHFSSSRFKLLNYPPSSPLNSDNPDQTNGANQYFPPRRASAYVLNLLWL